MADLHVQPKKKRSFLPWLLLALGLVALIIFLTRDRDDNQATNATAATDTYNNNSSHAAKPDHGWSSIDFAAPNANYSEISDRDISVRGNNDYSIYGLGENVLFDTDKATLRSDAATRLQQVVGSINQRFSGGEVRVYGYTDAQGSDAHNRQLSQQRAEAVRNWLSQNGIKEDRISIQPQGEANPTASNATEEGRQQNRRVEIVARKAS